ncbi:AlpA family phage regulatory protein [Pelomonas caseinilytica]|uniref:AlpA family phage regulatory protein n=1 Tax=Pelomonas caseinilytica TaxID=2906763 RepID=UPI003B019035
MFRLPRVQDLSGLGRSTIYRLMSMQLFPSAVRLGRRAVGRRLSDIAACSAPRPGLASPDPAAMLQGLCDPSSDRSRTTPPSTATWWACRTSARSRSGRSGTSCSRWTTNAAAA